MQTDAIKTMIEQGIPECQVIIDGDGTHYQAIVISNQFECKTMVQQHQMVYKVLGDKVGKEIHALSIQTYTQEEWDKQQELRVI